MDWFGPLNLFPEHERMCVCVGVKENKGRRGEKEREREVKTVKLTANMYKWQYWRLWSRSRGQFCKRSASPMIYGLHSHDTNINTRMTYRYRQKWWKLVRHCQRKMSSTIWPELSQPIRTTFRMYPCLDVNKKAEVNYVGFHTSSSRKNHSSSLTGSS